MKQEDRIHPFSSIKENLIQELVQITCFQES